MAEKPKSLLEGGSTNALGNALGEGAARFDQLIETVKAQYAPPADGTQKFATNPLLHVSPGEAWSRNFQSQSIGPNVQSLALSDLAPVPRAMVLPTAPEIVPPRTADIASRPVVTAPMSNQLGKPERLVKPRQSWLGRMFGRA
jgi:hypothetical protein